MWVCVGVCVSLLLAWWRCSAFLGGDTLGVSKPPCRSCARFGLVSVLLCPFFQMHVSTTSVCLQDIKFASLLPSLLFCHSSLSSLSCISHTTGDSAHSRRAHTRTSSGKSRCNGTNTRAQFTARAHSTTFSAISSELKLRRKRTFCPLCDLVISGLAFICWRGGSTRRCGQQGS